MGLLFPLHIISSFSAIIPLSAGAGRYSRLRPEAKLLLILFGLTVVFEAYGFYCGQTKQNVYWLFHIYTPLEYSLLMVVFSIWQKNAVLARALRLSIVVFAIICIVNALIPDSLTRMNSFTISLSCIVYTLVSAVTLISLKKADFGNISKDMRFWVSSGLLVYSSGSLAFFVFFPLIAQSYLVTVWAVYSVINIFAYVLFGIGFLCQCQQ
ncbi:MAG TPA: hypothetical protein DCZ43_02460 [candidate division Zixibacteria bacterium]|nr:hypothetical protein [candidate division Zixibacteria bacterium]